ncbi:membrane protein insertase YidC [Candidatus Kinetoplastibacterium sorsogonicusi]|nr:membrane protein insertase YidC [Candidatus Kinetoplastibacterium sorsogonicusi]
MDTKKLILWIIFSFSIMLLWHQWQNDYKQNQYIQTANNSITDSTTIIPNIYHDTKKYDTGDLINVKTDLLDITLDCLGAQIIKVKLLKYPSLMNKDEGTILLDKNDKNFYVVQSGIISNKAKEEFPNHQTNFTFNKDDSIFLGNQKKLVFEANVNNVLLKKIFLINEKSYNIQVIHKLTNNNKETIYPSLYLQIERDGNEPYGISKFYKTFTGFAVFSNKEKFQKISFDDITKNKQKYIKESSNGWIAMVQQYFTTALIPTPGINHKNEIVKINDLYKNTYVARVIENLEQVLPNHTISNTSNLWIGPQDQNTLSQLSEGLDLVVDYGFFTIIAKPLFLLLTLMYKIFNNWGWSIVFLTIFIKLIFFPLSSASYKSMAKLKDIAPKIQSLKEIYNEDKQKLNIALMDLYKTEKINPLGGCLPTLIQIPVFIALYWVLLSSVEMKGAPWILWINDLSAKDPFFILPSLMMLTMFLQIKLNPAPTDPIQAKIMMIMPIVFGFMMFFFPSGLVLYWCVNNTISIMQQWFITKNLYHS